MRFYLGLFCITQIIFIASTNTKIFRTVAAGSENIHEPEHKVGEFCTYLVTVGTTCTKGAETSNRVNLRFGDVQSNEILVKNLNSKHAGRVYPLEPQDLDDVPQKPFQACTVDQFRVTSKCMKSAICYLYFKLIGDDDWRPGFAGVRVLESHKFPLSSSRFYFRRYLPRRVWHGSNVCDPKITPFGLKYSTKIFAKEPSSANLQHN